jgi:hypothetical protein
LGSYGCSLIQALRWRDRSGPQMAGQIKQMIDFIVEQRGRGNPTITLTTKAKLVLKGVNPGSFTDASPDDPVVVAKVKAIAADFGVQMQDGPGGC